MRLSRIGGGEVLAGVSGLALLIALFLPWFADADAWEAFAVTDFLLAIAAAAGIALPVIATTNSKTDAPITAAALTVLGGAIATILVLYRILDPVGDGSRRIGLYLGAIASIGVMVGSWRAMADERT
jgi:hypothetical protein